MMHQSKTDSFKRIWLLWSVIVALAVSLTILIAVEDITPEEGDAIQVVQELPIGTVFPNLVRTATTAEVDLIVGAGLVAVLWRTGDRRALTILVLLLVVLPPVQHGLKLLVDRPRPPFDPTGLWSDPASPSFPSGHVMSATVVYGFLLYLSVREKWPPSFRVLARVLSLAVLGLTAVTSVYLEVHWPTDVLAGFLWGLVLLLPAVAVLLRVHRVLNATPGPLGGRKPHKT